MRKRIEALNARARAVMMPGRRGAGWRAQPFLIVPIALFGLAGAVAFGRSLPAGGAAPHTSVEAAGPPMGARAASAALATSPEATSDRIPSGDALDALLTRAGEVAALWDRVGDFVEGEIGPIERVLLGFRPDTALVRRIALALVAEARRVNLDPRILLAVLLVENPDLDPNARSFVGATGLMQVMPMHVGKWPPCGTDLEGIETNICYGARIFAHYYQQTGGDVERALLRYNGCVRGTNTPTCQTYPDQVFARAGRASVLAWLRPHGARAAAP